MFQLSLASMKFLQTDALAAHRGAGQGEGVRMGVNKHGMPIYIEIHKGHRSGDMNFGVMMGLIKDFTLEEMQEFRQTMCVVIGLAERAFADGDEQRNPTAQAVK